MNTYTYISKSNPNIIYKLRAGVTF